MFKVLSVSKALSIQAHPDKMLAALLFKDMPNVYKDGNHKPEMCIALSDYEVLCNFAPAEEIIRELRETPELRTIIGNNDIVDAFIRDKSSQALRGIFSALFEAHPNDVILYTNELIARLAAKKEHSSREKLTLVLNK